MLVGIGVGNCKSKEHSQGGLSEKVHLSQDLKEVESEPCRYLGSECSRQREHRGGMGVGLCLPWER